MVVRQIKLEVFTDGGMERESERERVNEARIRVSYFSLNNSTKILTGYICLRGYIIYI